MSVRFAAWFSLRGIPCYEGVMNGCFRRSVWQNQVHLAASPRLGMARPVPMQHLLLIALYSGQSTSVRTHVRCTYRRVWARMNAFH